MEGGEGKASRALARDARARQQGDRAARTVLLGPSGWTRSPGGCRSGRGCCPSAYKKETMGERGGEGQQGEGERSKESKERKEKEQKTGLW